MARAYKDNFKQTQSEIARRIRDSRPWACLTEYHRERIVLIIAESGDTRFNSGLSGLRFERAASGVDLYIKMDDAWRDAPDPMLDGDGNEYTRFTVEFQVSYPMHGSCSPDVAMARAALITDVAMLAAELKAEFGEQGINGYWRMTRTASEIAEQKERTRKEALKTALWTLVDKNRKGLRRGGVCKWTSSKDIPPGRHEVKFNDGKEYVVTAAVPDLEGSTVAVCSVIRTA